MKRNTILAFIILIMLTTISCTHSKAHNIDITQSSRFDSQVNKYSVETKLEINNRFGFSQHVSIWEDETINRSDIDALLKLQKSKADSVCRTFK